MRGKSFYVSCKKIITCIIWIANIYVYKNIIYNTNSPCVRKKSSGKEELHT